MRRILHAPCVMLAFVIAGCGGGGGSGADPAPGGDYYPVAVGNAWNYDYVDLARGLGTGPRTISVVSTTTIEGATAYEVKWDCCSQVIERIVKTGSEVRRYGAAAGVAGPRVLLKFPVRVGDAWELHETVSSDPSDPATAMQVDIQSRVDRFESVDTPAGALLAAVVISNETDSLLLACAQQDPFCQAKSVETDWYAPGVGLVKRQVSYSAQFNSFHPENHTETLRSYTLH